MSVQEQKQGQERVNIQQLPTGGARQEISVNGVTLR